MTFFCANCNNYYVYLNSNFYNAVTFSRYMSYKNLYKITYLKAFTSEKFKRKFFPPLCIVSHTKLFFTKMLL